MFFIMSLLRDLQKFETIKSIKKYGKTILI